MSGAVSPVGSLADSDSNRDESELVGDEQCQGPAMPNTLATTLALFPLAETHESRGTGKRRREQEAHDARLWPDEALRGPLAEVPVLANERKLSEALQDVLFPSEDDMLGDTLDRLRVETNTVMKRRKAPQGQAVSVMNRRVMALLEQSTIVNGKGLPHPPRLPPVLLKAKHKLKVVVPPTKPQLLATKGLLATQVVRPRLPTAAALAGSSTTARLEQTLGTLAAAPVKSYTYMMPNEFGVRMVTPVKLYDYQVEAVKWLIDREEGHVRNDYYEPGINGCLLAMVMGLGKTPTAATLVARTIRQQRAAGSCSIYVCPKNLLGTVRHEFEKFFGDQLRIIIYHQNFLRSEYNTFGASDIRKYDVIITNYSTVTSRMSAYNKVVGVPGLPKTKGKAPGVTAAATQGYLPAAIREFCEFPWFRIILDEAHEIRERRTARFRTMMQMRSPRRICMTGTPIHNKINDLYAQMEFTGLRLPRGTKQTKQNLHQLKITNMIRFVEHKDAESVTLPPKHVHKVYFDLNEEEKLLHRFYNDSARSVFAQSQSESGRSKGKKTLEALAGIIRVLQVCSAPYLVTPGSKETHAADDICEVDPAMIFPADPRINRWIHQRDGTAGLESSKMRAFVQLMARLRHRYETERTPLKVVVFANMTSTLRLAQAALQKHVPNYDPRSVLVSGDISTVKREELFTRFRIEPGVETLFMTLKLGSIGLNLTESDTVIFLEPWYSYASLSQGESRVHRIGQVREVNVFYLMGKDSAEERVYRVAQNKKTLSEDIKSGTADAHKLHPDEMRFVMMEEVDV